MKKYMFLSFIGTNHCEYCYGAATQEGIERKRKYILFLTAAILVNGIK